MKIISLNNTFIVLLVVFATSCKKNNLTVKNSTSNGGISYFAKASGTGIKATATRSNNILSGTAVVEWSSASIYVEKISFVGISNNLLDTTISVEKNLNLFSADALAGVINLPTGSYKDVKVKMFLKKSPKSELAFNLKGTFINTWGGRDSLMVASSYPFEANLGVTDITINPSDNYTVIFNFNLDKGLTGISTELLQTARSYAGIDNKLMYVIWKGGSQDEPLYNEIINNWQTVASVTISKK